LLFQDKDKDLTIIPWLAEAWRLVNPTTWEFKIRKGVKFRVWRLLAQGVPSKKSSAAINLHSAD